MAKVKGFFNPAKRSKKYAQELHTGLENKTAVILQPNQKAFRAGYMTCRSDEAGMYNYKKAKELKKNRK